MRQFTTRKHAVQTPEALLISLVWIVLIAAPFLFGDNQGYSTWKSMLKPLETVIPLAIVFLLNRFVLVPLILFRVEKLQYLPYLIAVGILIGMVTIVFYLVASPGQANRPPPPPMEMRFQQPPPLPPNRKPEPVPPYMNVLIFSILLAGFDTGLRISARLARSERERALLERENMETHLTMLRNQVSPHFFMNTLNNIHALIDIDTTEAKEAVIRLSNMMRYLLYETDMSRTSLIKELEFVKSYIDLMKLRYTENITIKLTIPERIPEKQVPPLLFTALIENAFKHGISYKTRSYVVIDFLIDETRLILRIRNSIGQNGKQSPASGIGIWNTRKRLDLLYGDAYHLDILNDGSEFNVYLSIPL